MSTSSWIKWLDHSRVEFPITGNGFFLMFKHDQKKKNLPKLSVLECENKQAKQIIIRVHG